MTLTRRSFLTAIAAVATALGLPGTVAKAEPAHDPWCPCRFDMAPAEVERLKQQGTGYTREQIDAAYILYDAVADGPTSALWFTEDAIQHGDGPSGWTDEGFERIYMIDGVRVSRDVYAAWLPLTFVPLTFKAMQADCESRGCVLGIVRLTTLAFLDHRSVRGIVRITFKDADDQRLVAPIDRWRRSLHAEGG